jgi:hypothetical protein
MAQHPEDTAKSLTDWSDLSSGNISAWLGHFAPTLAAFVATKGASALAGGGTATEATSGLSLSTADSWGNPATLARHFADHGADFGATSEGEYASQASQFLQRSQADGLPTRIDANGVIRSYDPSTNEFGSFNADGTTKTYFAPDPAVHGFATNWDYWLSQAGDEPWTP